MIDTLKLSKRLQETGLSEVKTLAFVDVLREIPGAKPDRPFDTLAVDRRRLYRAPGRAAGGSRSRRVAAQAPCHAAARRLRSRRPVP